MQKELLTSGVDIISSSLMGNHEWVPRYFLGSDSMSIIYNKLITKMKEAGMTSYTMKRDKIIGQATYKKIMQGGDIDTRTIDKLCEALDCQPGDILEYVPDTASDEK